MIIYNKNHLYTNYPYSSLELVEEVKPFKKIKDSSSSLRNNDQINAKIKLTKENREFLQTLGFRLKE
jgi:hypothetical protein